MKTKRQARGIVFVAAGMVAGLAMPAWGDEAGAVGAAGETEQWGLRIFERAHGFDGSGEFHGYAARSERSEAAAEEDLREHAVQPHLPEADRVDMPAARKDWKPEEQGEGDEYRVGWSASERDDDVMGIPEASTLAMLGMAALATVGRRRRRA